MTPAFELLFASIIFGLVFGVGVIAMAAMVMGY